MSRAHLIVVCRNLTLFFSATMTTVFNETKENHPAADVVTGMSTPEKLIGRSCEHTGMTTPAKKRYVQVYIQYILYI